MTKSKVDKIVNNIRDKYNKRYEKIQTVINGTTGGYPVDLVNFNTYLIKKHNKPNLSK